jgi:hypothetical protein
MTLLSSLLQLRRLAVVALRVAGVPRDAAPAGPFVESPAPIRREGSKPK